MTDITALRLKEKSDGEERSATISISSAFLETTVTGCLCFLIDEDCCLIAA